MTLILMQHLELRSPEADVVKDIAFGDGNLRFDSRAG